MAKRRITVFISHSWKHHGSEYHRLSELLSNYDRIHFSIMAVPEHEPVFLENSGVARI